jgi:hypothetical protein
MPSADACTAVNSIPQALRAESLNLESSARRSTMSWKGGESLIRIFNDLSDLERRVEE